MLPTPRPWHYDGKFTVIIPAEEGEYCFRTNREDAAHIVHCVNVHDDLVAVLKTVHSYYTDLHRYPMVPVGDLRRILEETLAKVNQR